MILSELDLVNVARTQLPASAVIGKAMTVSVLLDKDTKHWLGTTYKFANVRFIGDALGWSYEGYGLANSKDANTALNLPTMAILYSEWRRAGNEEVFVEFIASLRGQDADGIPVEEDLIGLLNGVNSVFMTTYDFVPETLMVFVNGIKQRQLVDYNTSGTRTVEFFVSPEVGDLISSRYSKK